MVIADNYKLSFIFDRPIIYKTITLIGQSDKVVSVGSFFIPGDLFGSPLIGWFKE